MMGRYWEEMPVDESPGATLARAMADTEAMGNADGRNGEVLGFIVLGVTRWTREDGREQEGVDITYSPSISHAHGLGILHVGLDWWMNAPPGESS